MTILVTGGKGFLGRVLVEKLRQQDYKTIVIDSKLCDLSQPESLKTLQAIHANFVFHLAAKTGVASSWQNPAAYYRANLSSTQNVLEYCRMKQVPLHFVSAYIYGNLGNDPISETMAPKPNNPYAHSKWMGEELCRFYANAFALPITISRPFNIYGPNQLSDFFIPRMIDQLQKGEKISVRTLAPKRDYVFVEDAADALIAIMHRGVPGECYNIGSGSCFSCLEIIEHLQALMGIQKPIHSEHQKLAEDIMHAQADIAKIQSLNWHPSHSLKEGLLKCLGLRGC